MTKVVPVILSGGSGTRLWPMSRALSPKQFLPLVSQRTMLQEAASRVSTDAALFDAPIVICNNEHRFVVAEQLREAGIEPQAILLEPVGRNTAPAAAVAALHALSQAGAGDEDVLLLVMPSDHRIADVAAFTEAVTTASEAARRGALVTFGIEPTRPETGYGYIQRGDKKIGGAFEVARFVEKPDAETARGYVERGDFYWNSGIFLFGARALLDEMDRLCPELAAACRAAHGEIEGDLDFQRLPDRAFGAVKSISIDYAVMEHTSRAAVVPVDMGWSDVGAWDALWDIAERDENGTAIAGDVIGRDVRNSYLRSEGPLVAAIGVEDTVVVATDDAVLVTSMDRAQEVKSIVEELKRSGRDEASNHLVVYRPWGSYKGIGRGDRYQVKRIIVEPGRKLSLQMHHHRAEHWVVVSGTARVTRGEDTFLLHENESTFIPQGVVHRLENPGRVPLHLIEVQSGGYLGEDDIVRIDDDFGRR